MNTQISSRQQVRRLRLIFIAAVLATLSTTGLAAPADAASGQILTLQKNYCYNPANGLGTAQVPAPGLRPMPRNYNPNISVVGDDSQRVTYRPYLQRWTGTSWVIDRHGPVFTGTTGMVYTTWDQSNGLWTPTFTVDPRLKRYYRFGAEIWWNADAHHAAGYAAGIGLHLQWSGTLWYWTDYCTF